MRSWLVACMAREREYPNPLRTSWWLIQNRVIQLVQKFLHPPNLAVVVQLSHLVGLWVQFWLRSRKLPKSDPLTNIKIGNLVTQGMFGSGAYKPFMAFPRTRPGLGSRTSPESPDSMMGGFAQ